MQLQPPRSLNGMQLVYAACLLSGSRVGLDRYQLYQQVGRLKPRIVVLAPPPTTYAAHGCPGDELLLASPLAREPHAGSGALLDRLSPGTEGRPRHDATTADSPAADMHQYSNAATHDAAAPDASQLAEQLHATSMRGDSGADDAAPGGSPPLAHQPAGAALLGGHGAGPRTESSQSQAVADAQQPVAPGTAQHPLATSDLAPSVGYPMPEPIAHASQQAAASPPAQPPQQQASQQPAVQPAATAEQDPPSQRRW